MASREPHMCENCGNPAPLELPFCGSCGHANDPEKVIVATAPPAPDQSPVPNGRGLDPHVELDPDVWGDFAARPIAPQGPATPSGVTPDAAAAVALRHAPEPGPTAPPGMSDAVSDVPVQPVPHVVAPPPVPPSPSPEVAAGAAPEPSGSHRSRTPLVLAVVAVVLAVVAVSIVLVAGSSNKGAKGSATTATTVAPAHGSSASSTTPSGPSRSVVLAGTASAPWVAQATPSGSTVNNLFDIACVSPTTCWAVGKTGQNRYCGSGCISKAVILATTNGGQTWESQQYPTSTGLNSNGYVFSVSCVSASTCMAAGSGNQMVILSTHDGGATWVSDPYPAALAAGHLFQAYCVTASHCWAIGSTATAPFVLATTDGGQTWSQQNLPAGLDFGTNGLYDIACTTTSHCFMAANVGGSLAILTSGNGGSSWSVQPYPSNISAKTDGIGFISCPTARSCYISGPETSSSGGSPVILGTHDGGATWSSQHYPSSLGLTGIDKLRCADASHCWAVATGASGSVMLATSDGSSWAVQPMPSNLGLGSQGLVGVACPRVSTCWAVANNTKTNTALILAARPGA